MSAQSDASVERFDVRFSPRLRWLVTAFGMGPNRSGVLLSPDSLRVQAGLFRTEIPRSAIMAVDEIQAPWWALDGVHSDLRGRWIVNGAPGRLLRLQLSKPIDGSIAGLRIRIRCLDLGLTDSARLRRALKLGDAE